MIGKREAILLDGIIKVLPYVVHSLNQINIGYENQKRGIGVKLIPLFFLPIKIYVKAPSIHIKWAQLKTR